MMALIGFFLIRAAWQADPDEAEGSTARYVKHRHRRSAWCWCSCRVGLIVYGVYCVVSAPRRRLAPADG